MRWLAEKNLVRVSIPGGRRFVLVLRSAFHSAYSAAFLFSSDIIISLRDCCSFCCTLWLQLSACRYYHGMVLIVITAHAFSQTSKSLHSIRQYPAANCRVHYRLRCKDGRLAHAWRVRRRI
jgi:hypothetical protein